MGYSTNFDGVLKFKSVLTPEQIAKVRSFLGEDCREHPEWEGSRGLTYIDLKFLGRRNNEDFSGLEWNGSEKTYQLVEKVNLIITEMRKEYPDFGLEGSILAQGEDIDDRWILSIENGLAVEKMLGIVGKEIQCPNCGNHFTLEIEE